MNKLNCLPIFLSIFINKIFCEEKVNFFLTFKGLIWGQGQILYIYVSNRMTNR